MKKFFLSAFVIITFIFYVIYQRSGGFREVTEGPLSFPQTNQPSPQAVVPTATPRVTPPAPQTAGQGFKDGQYTGGVVDVLYGNVQVQATISDGKITDVKFLQYPSDRRTSISINTQAMPILTQEAIQAQSAQVDTVTGASATSAGFKESLQSALNQAKS